MMGRTHAGAVAVKEAAGVWYSGWFHAFRHGGGLKTPGSSVSKPKPSWSHYQEGFAIHKFHHAASPFTSEPKDTVEVDAKGS